MVTLNTIKKKPLQCKIFLHITLVIIEVYNTFWYGWDVKCEGEITIFEVYIMQLKLLRIYEVYSIYYIFTVDEVILLVT